MPASKKRIKLRSAASAPEQKVPAALKEWVHIWHGVTVDHGSHSAIFHAGSRVEELSFWRQFVRLPSNSLFPNVETHANPRKEYKDFLYVLLNMRWPMLFMVLLLVFVSQIFLFALIVCYGCREPRVFLEAFDLSYQTFTTIGYGIVFPERTCSNLVMTIESFASMLVLSAITGLVFAKFAKPIPKIAFSKVCVVQPYGKEYLALVVRVANATQSRDVTHDVIMEANFKLNLLRVEQNRSSSSFGQTSMFFGNESTSTATSTSKNKNNESLCSYNLKILQNNFITFRMGIAVVHVIDEESPFFGMAEQDILGSDMVLEVAMSGVDSTLQDTVADRFIYTAHDFKWGYRFSELLEFNERNAEVIMNFAKLSSVERAPIDNAKYIRPPPFAGGNAAAPRHNSSWRRSSHRVSESQAFDAESANGLEPIHEIESTEDPDMFRRRRSSSTDTGNTERILRRVPSKCSLGMEPLFEPLLQRSIGTQRIPNELPPMEGGARQGRYGRLPSGPNAMERGEKESNPMTEFVIPMPQKRQLQSQLAGDVVSGDEDETSTLSDDNGEGEDQLDDADGSSEDDEIAYNRRSRPSKSRQSGVSIDVEDTPRFLKISPLNIPKTYDFMRLYHSALHVRWPKIIFVFVLAFLGINLVFGLLYWLRSDDMESYVDVTVTSFERAFFMSVHTLATIGYGSIAPKPSSLYINFWVLVESSLGIIAVTIITGIAWSKFARPRAHIHFSSKIALCRIYGHRCLVFRAANTRHSGDVHENFFRIGVILTNRKTGLRQMYDVPLVTAEWPSIKLPATLIHIIDATSPFYKFETMDDLSESRVAVIALLTGLDTTFSENVYARKMYFWDDFTCDMRFADFARIERDRVVVDYAKFDSLELEVTSSSL
uniref:Inward rectifier potassium channel C-terminal domain-containing protein n=1 Tax=Globisporangium ultimum (strain ATCC 200006 / CBS 805.95 / DAOM BR144) TaxID=431595 RepID=K3WU57_GLOUD